MYAIIVEDQLTRAEKIAERKHWLWGQQCLMIWKVGVYQGTNKVLTRTRAKWMSPKHVIIYQPPTNTDKTTEV